MVFSFRNAFVSCKDTEERTKWIGILQKELGFAALMCNANNTQLGSYIMKKIEMAYRNGGLEKKEMVTVVGRQKGDQEMWVFNSKIHIDGNGRQVDPSESPYIWTKSMDSLASEISCVKKSKSKIRSLISAIERSYGVNCPAVLLTLGASVLCFHYQFLNEKSFSVPATILTGAVSAGKSRASQIALSLTGSQKTSFITSVTQSKMKSITSKTTIGIVLDDPKDPIDIIDKVMHHYDRGKSCSQSSTDVPQTTFLTTVNTQFLIKLSEMHPK